VPTVLVVALAVRWAIVRCKCRKNTKLLRTRCVSQAQNAPKLVFGGSVDSTATSLLVLNDCARPPSTVHQ